MVENVASPPVIKRRETVRSPEASRGNRAKEIERVGATLINNKAYEVRAKINSLTGDERAQYITGNPGEARLYGLAGLASIEPGTYPAGTYDYSSDNPTTVKTSKGEGTLLEIKGSTDDTFTCEIKVGDETVIEIVPREDVIDARLIAVGDELATAFTGDEAEIVRTLIQVRQHGEASLSSDTQDPRHQALTEKITSVAEASNILTKTKLQAHIDNNLADLPEPTEETQKAEVAKQNTDRKALREKLLAACTGELVDIDTLEELIFSQQENSGQFSAMAKEAEEAIAALKPRLMLRVGAPNPDNPQLPVTQEDLDGWKDELDERTAQARVFKRLAGKVKEEKGSERSVVGTIFSQIESGEIPPETAKRIIELFVNGDYEGIVKIAIEHYQGEVSVEKNGAATVRRREERIKRMTNLMKNIAGKGGALMAMALLLGLMQGSKGQ